MARAEEDEHVLRSGRVEEEFAGYAGRVDGVGAALDGEQWRAGAAGMTGSGGSGAPESTRAFTESGDLRIVARSIADETARVYTEV